MQLLGWIVLGAWVMALLRTIINLLVVRPIPTVPPERTPLVSILIPARDEERAIERTVRALLAQTYPNVEIIVLNDRSTDSTGAILDRLAAEDARVTVLHGEEPPSGWLGKPWALHQASLRAKGELLLFVDADVVYAPAAVSAAVAYLERNDEVTMVALLPNFEMGTLGEQFAMPMMAFTVIAIMPLWLANRTRIPILGAGGGTGNLVRRAEYEAAGGHEKLKAAVVDDVGLAHMMRRAGHRTQAVRADHLVSVRMYVGLRQVIEGFTKNGFAVFGNHLSVVAMMVLLTLLFHLGPYVLALAGDPVAIATVAIITITRLIIFEVLGFPIWNAVFGHPPMILLWSWILVRSAWFNGVRKKLTWRGRTYDATRTRFGAD